MSVFTAVLLFSVSFVCLSTAQNITTQAPPIVGEVCYDYVGCFKNATPFDNAHGVLPADPTSFGIITLLFSRDNPTSPDHLDFTDNSSAVGSHFNPQRPTKLIVHGFTGSFTESGWMNKTKDALLEKGDFNVLAVDWGKGATFPDYDQAVANVRVVAKALTLILDQLNDLGMDYGDLHLIGHSLGAQISGSIGMLVGSNTVGRISGLDPAEPGFDKLPAAVELDKTDAKFVDIMHTNGDNFNLVSGGFGLLTPVGHVDFYMNGGVEQRGCTDGAGGISAGLDAFIHGGSLFSAVGTGVSCSHGRAHDYFVESINTNCTFKAFPCENYAKFENGDCFSCANGCSVAGYDADQYPARGSFYLDTASDSPYCGVYYHLNLYPAKPAVNTTGTLSVRLVGTAGTTEFSKVTKINGDLSRQTQLNMNVIFSKYVGEITAVDVKYEREVGFFSFLTTSSPEFYIGGLEIKSEDTGASFGSCLGETRLPDKQPVIFALQKDRSPMTSPCPISTIIG